MKKILTPLLILSNFIILGCPYNNLPYYDDVVISNKALLSSYYSCLFSKINKNDSNYKHLAENYSTYSKLSSTNADDSRYKILIPWVEKASEKYKCSN
ncbi:MAG: hypothetical protein U0457_00870 [Candidatus Sericytochromatia bacterium]